MAAQAPAARLIGLFGPTAVGKTAVAIELARLVRARGGDPLALSCDAIQIYRGLEVISGAADAAEQAELEHRLIGIADPSEEFSAGRFAELSRAEIDAGLDAGRTVIVVGGTGLYMRAALAELELRPPVDPAIRKRIEAEIADRGPEALHAELPADVAARVHPNDRKRIARALELLRSGEDPPERASELWTARLRRPALLVGLVCERAQLDARIRARVESMFEAGAQAEARALLAGRPSRTASAALGLEAFAAGDREAVVRAHRRFARRQMTWLRKMPQIAVVETDDADPAAAAKRIGAMLGDTAPR